MCRSPPLNQLGDKLVGQRSRQTPPPPGYLASDESMFIPSDISDTSDWEWIAGGFPCRDVARERFISDSCKTQIQNGITLNPSLPKNNIKNEILEDNTIQVGDQQVECPISIISAGPKPTSRDQSVIPQAEDTSISKLPDSQYNSSNPADKDTLTDFPVYEVVDSADDSTPTTVPSNKPGNDPPIIRRSNRNVGPPKFYDKRYFIDVVDLPQEISGSASNPIVIEIDDTNQQEFNNSGTPVELVTIDSDSLSPDQISSSSTNESLRMAIDNFGDQSELDSEVFHAELENFLDSYRNCKC